MDPRLTFHFQHGTDPRIPSCPSPRCTPRQRASSAQVPSDSPSQATEASRIPPFEDGVPSSPSSPAPQCRYKTRRPPNTPGATTSHPKSSVRHPPTRRARILGPGESSKASQPKPPIDSEVPFDLSPECYQTLDAHSIAH